MYRLAHDLVLAGLRNPEKLPALPLDAWDVFIRQARSAGLLARMAILLDERKLLEQVPDAPRAHLHAAQLLALAQGDTVRREIAHIQRALAALGVPVILLKGAAYEAAQLPAARGRLFSDIDILVPRARLPEAEAALMLHGWATTHHSAYDQRYYRQWMHELPPMQHIRRHTTLDVHHAILPLTARLRPDAAKLIAAAQPVDANDHLRVLAPPDMVLHSMTHLFHNEELTHGLRDLSDIDTLLRDFATTPAFWDELVDRARELDLERPLHYGLRHAHALLGTPVPAHTLAAAGRAGPRWPLSALMDHLWTQALRAPHPSAAGRLTPLALSALYMRAHWLRMPPPLLARHLTIKAFARTPSGKEAG